VQGQAAEELLGKRIARYVHFISRPITSELYRSLVKLIDPLKDLKLGYALVLKMMVPRQANCSVHGVCFPHPPSNRGKEALRG